MDPEGIIQCIKEGDENGIQTQLQNFNKEVTPHRRSHIVVLLVTTCFKHRLSPTVCPVLLLRRRGERAKESKFYYVGSVQLLPTCMPPSICD